MPKKVKEINYVLAIQAMLGEYIPLDGDGEGESEDGTRITLSAKALNPEEYAIKKDLFAKLSDEAREVVSIVVECPAEILSLVTTPKTGKLSKNKIKKYFEVTWRSKFIVSEVLNELREYAKQL